MDTPRSSQHIALDVGCIGNSEEPMFNSHASARVRKLAISISDSFPQGADIKGFGGLKQPVHQSHQILGGLWAGECWSVYGSRKPHLVPHMEVPFRIPPSRR